MQDARYIRGTAKDKSFLAEAIMEKHSVASAVTVILPSDGGTANAVAQIRLEWGYAKENNNSSQKYARLYTAAENRSVEVQWFGAISPVSAVGDALARKTRRFSTGW